MSGTIKDSSPEKLLLIKLTSDFQYCGNLETSQVILEIYDVTTHSDLFVEDVVFSPTTPSVIKPE